ncbi:hypothetical protein ACOME3_000207 [Neoechinorhynchus agilis]
MDTAVYDILRCLLDRVENLLQNPGSGVDPSNVPIPASSRVTGRSGLQMGARDSSDSRINQPANQNEFADLLGLRNDSPRITNHFPASVPTPQANLMNELTASMRSVAPIIAASFPVLFDFVNRSSDNAQNNNQRTASTATQNAQGLIGRNVPRIEQPSGYSEQSRLVKQFDNMIRREATNYNNAGDSNKRNGDNRDRNANTENISACHSSSKYRQQTDEKICCQRCYRTKSSSYYRCYNLLLCKNCAPQMARKVFVRSREKQTQDLNKHQRSSADLPNRNSSNTVNADRAQQQNSRDDKICVMCKINKSSRWQKFGEFWICQKCIDLCTFSVMAQLANIQVAAGRQTSASWGAAQTNALNPNIVHAPTHAMKPMFSDVQEIISNESPAIKSSQHHVPSTGSLHGSHNPHRRCNESSCSKCSANESTQWYSYGRFKFCETCIGTIVPGSKRPSENVQTNYVQTFQNEQAHDTPARNPEFEFVSIVPEPGIAESSSMYDSDGLCQCETCMKFKNPVNQSAASSIGRQIDKSETVNAPIAVTEKAVTKSDKQERRNPNDSRFKHLNQRLFCCRCKKITKTLRYRRGNLYYCQRCFQLEQTTASGSITNPLAGSSFAAPVAHFIAVTRAEEDSIERFIDHQTAFCLEAPSIKTDYLENRKSTATIQASLRLARESQERGDDQSAESKKRE